MKNHVSVIIFLVGMFMRKEFAIYYIPLLDIQCTNFLLKIEKSNKQIVILPFAYY